MYATFDRFEIQMTLKEAKSASHQGQCDDDVEALVGTSKIKRQLDKIGYLPIRNELAEYGAWDAHELQDDEANRRRIVWIASGNIQDN